MVISVIAHYLKTFYSQPPRPYDHNHTPITLIFVITIAVVITVIVIVITKLGRFAHNCNFANTIIIATIVTASNKNIR